MSTIFLFSSLYVPAYSGGFQTTFLFSTREQAQFVKTILDQENQTIPSNG